MSVIVSLWTSAFSLHYVSLMSMAEDLCFRSLCKLIRGNITRNYRPDWLRNPDTGRNLEIDLWVKSYGLGIEVQGDHHIFDQYQIKKDNIKRSIFRERGYVLIEVGVGEVDPFSLLHHLKRAETRKPIKYRGRPDSDVFQVMMRRAVQGKFNQQYQYCNFAKKEYGNTALSPQRFEKRAKQELCYREFLLGLQIKSKALVRWYGSVSPARLISFDPETKLLLVSIDGRNESVKWRHVVEFV